ncbi:iron chelate uptake ABC transporter family permease subunit [Moritella sp. F3]|uniref:iron chelate uptake ABC transporter family permease subunit n=1 Tax=Moritella sp. F3 TaxID=2718882 RepID=UPI0018E186E3|nr:iron chelate uptake ABC transporter family permease subunit [Moritella sp. F3]GIC75739.1 ABC transporter permease [Moritella sp. F1]GIC81813.1 ABC transporter permease [Moritella sp. F3]
MSDAMKLTGLAAITVLFTFLFIGVGLDASNYEYFLSRRVPKVLAMIIASIAIAQSSLVFQTITHNRILTPSIMGFDALYLLTQVLVVVIFGGFSVLLLNPFINFVLSVSIMVGFSLLLFGFYFARNDGKSNVITLLLLGVIFGQLFDNVSSFFMMLVDPNDFLTIQASMFASFNNVNQELVYLCVIPLLIVSALLFKLAPVLDVFWLDNDNAISLGVDTRRITKQVLILVAIMISLSTALVGPVMFFGLLVANLTKEFFSTYRHKTLLIASSLMAMSMLLSGQWIIENVFSFSTTLSVVINFVGGLYFLSLLVRQKIQ